jgi:hypothetical protein
MVSFFGISNLILSIALIFFNSLQNENEKTTTGKKNVTLLDLIILIVGILEIIFLLLKIKLNGF